MGDLTDASVPIRTQRSITQTLYRIKADAPGLLSIRELRARRAGSLIFVDVVAEVDGKLTAQNLVQLDQTLTRAVREARPEVAELRIKFETGKVV